jgi:dephospho-CoA kinase
LKVIGITGGVGCGKSTVLDYLQTACSCLIVKADEVTHRLYEPGGSCHDALVALYEEYGQPGDGPLTDGSGRLLHSEMSARMFRSAQLRKKVDGLLHPAVIAELKAEIDDYRAGKLCGSDGKPYDFYFLEAALLIENGFLEVVDEMWYIYCPDAVRRKRLKDSRGYTDRQIDRIMSSQLTEREFRENCSFVIDNGGTPAKMHAAIDARLAGSGAESREDK